MLIFKNNIISLFNFGRVRALYILNNFRHCTFSKFGYIEIENDFPILLLHDIIISEIKLPIL